jgi:hypothetical protein
MSNAEADLVAPAVLDGAQRPASVDPALWEAVCRLYARLKAMSDEERTALLEEVFATRH